MTEVVVIGAGLAGLSCALSLEAAGVQVTLLEASDAPGGRVRTDEVEGFRLDRGFQVLLTAYPEAKRLLDYDGLQLKKFEPGALVSAWGQVSSFRRSLPQSLGWGPVPVGPIVRWKDKLQVANLRAWVQRGTGRKCLRGPRRPRAIICRRFQFTPTSSNGSLSRSSAAFFLERELVTSSRFFFEFLFRMF